MSLDISPPGGLPYHIDEMGRHTNHDANIIAKTGLLGVIILLSCVFVSLLMFVVSFPFLLLGAAEVVAAAPNHYRIRWIRQDTP